MALTRPLKVFAAVRSLPACIAGLLLMLLVSPARADVFSAEPVTSAAANLAAAADVPDDFVEEVAFDGLTAPASVAFSPDGRVFVGQLDGVIKVYDDVEDTTPAVYADLRPQVAWHNDRGLIGLTLDPAFTSGRPYVYALYTRDAEIGGQAPRWNDNCTDPPGAERDGCVVSGRLSKILPDGTEQPLISDEWCQQYPSHSVGDLKFGADGALYVTAGDGASYTFADYGQDGAPVNPCGDPPGGVGGSMTPPTAEGGALRAQDVRTTGDRTGLNGALLRVEPDTGQPLPDNPGTGDLNARRIIAHGFRNPFRLAFRPGTNDAYVADVGWLTWEEIDRVPDTSRVRNYGWPCYEGSARQSGYEAIGLNLCESLYDSGDVVAPVFSYRHGVKLGNENCSEWTSSISALTFYDGATFPSAYQGALFFADYARMCIWVMFPGPDGTPNPATRQVFAEGAQFPVDLEVGPGGDLYYVDVAGGAIRRIRAVNPNQAPTASFTATPPAGATPLEVEFDASSSSDPNGDQLEYAWDLDGDGAYDDSDSVTPTRTYTQDGEVTVRLRVSDPSGMADTEQHKITAGSPPTAEITGPGADATYAVGETVAFAGTATDPDGSAVPAERMSWTVDLNHCSAIVSTSCHVHHITDFAGVRSGSFKYPDHEYPSSITLTLTVTSPSGLRAEESVRIEPKTVDLRFDSEPSGLSVAVGGEASTTPFTRRVARGSTVGVAAPPTQLRDGRNYDFTSWSDGGAATHQFAAPEAATGYVVRYAETACPVRDGLVGAWGFDEPSSTVVYDASGRANHGTISGATRTAAGRFGSALSFDGVNDLVTVADSASLDAYSGLTLEGWVNPAQFGSMWRTVMLKEQPGDLAWALYANQGSGLPSGHVATPFEHRTAGPSLVANAWSHLATTYDGTTLRLYVNGEEVSALPVTGALTESGGALRIGGNTVWAEWFAGLIDELRVYDRALSGAEVRVDMARAVTCVSEPQAPVLAVAPASLAFEIDPAAVSRATKTLDVRNTGGGTLSWTASANVPWLDVTPGSGTDAGTVTVTADASELPPGSHSGAVTIASAGASGSPRVIPVSVDVSAPPELSVAPSALAFSATAGGSAPAPRTLALSNRGGGTLEWTASVDAPWLSVTPASGSGEGEVTVAASLAGLAAGTHTATVRVAAEGASGSPVLVPVSFTVGPAPEPPLLAVAPSALEFSAVEGSTSVETKAVNVTNAGGGTLTFEAEADVPWLSVSPGAGTAPRTVSVTPVLAGLAPGVHRGTVLVGGGAASRSVAVTLTVTAAPACATPAGLVGAWGFDELSGTNATDAASGQHTGVISGATRVALGRHGGALRFDGVNDLVTIADADALDLRTGMTISAWVNPTAIAGSWRTVIFKERGAGINYALYAGTDTSQAGGYIATPAEVSTKSTSAVPGGVWTHLATTFDGSTLRMFVNGVQASTRAIAASATVGTGPLTIGGNRIWPEWFSGLIDEARVYDRALAAADIQADMAAPVTCATMPPALDVTPSSLAFSATAGGASPAAKSLTVSNTGGGTLDWSASEDASWLAVSRSGSTITVAPTITGLSAGTYTANISVTSNGGNKTVPVTLTLAEPPPALDVTPSSLAFSATAGGASPAAKSLTVSNTGGGTLDWSASEDASWLAVSRSGSTITVAPTITGLSAGTYTANISVTSNGGNKTVPVTLTLAEPPPALAVTPESLSFAATAGESSPAAKTLTVANTGGGTLDWSASEDASWLAVSRSGSTITVAPTITGLAAGTYTANVSVTSNGGNKTVPVTLTVSPPPLPAGLIAAYGFEESGATVTDSSGSGHIGTISGATRTASGRFGSALSFDGVNDWVTIADTNTLDLTTGVTMSAWINPSAVGTVYRTVVMKEQPGGLIYTLYAGDGTGKPSGHVFTNTEYRATGTSNTPLNTWTHLASTWDGSTLRIYVDGVQVGSRALTGQLRTSTGVLRIGGTSVWPEWFQGRIDEVRVYDRALTLPELQGDMTRPVVSP